jgi:hypothetical protein
MPKLDWTGKQYVVNHTDEVPFRLLDRIPEASMGDGGTPSGNVIVHGDNLEALLPYYRERVNLVFIDPPYNTGNENWVYNDRMNAPKITAWLGNDRATLDPGHPRSRARTKPPAEPLSRAPPGAPGPRLGLAVYG